MFSLFFFREKERFHGRKGKERYWCKIEKRVKTDIVNKWRFQTNRTSAIITSTKGLAKHNETIMNAKMIILKALFFYLHFELKAS